MATDFSIAFFDGSAIIGYANFIFGISIVPTTSNPLYICFFPVEPSVSIVSTLFNGSSSTSPGLLLSLSSLSVGFICCPKLLTNLLASCSSAYLVY